MRNYIISEFLNHQGMLTCPVCNKEFKPNDDTNYIVSGGFTCSSKCFFVEVRKKAEEKRWNANKK